MCFFYLKKKFKFLLPLYNFLKLTSFRSFALLGFLSKKKKTFFTSFKTLGKHMTHEASQNSKKIENRFTLVNSESQSEKRHSKTHHNENIAGQNIYMLVFR